MRRILSRLLEPAPALSFSDRLSRRVDGFRSKSWEEFARPARDSLKSDQYDRSASAYWRHPAPQLTGYVESTIEISALGAQTFRAYFWLTALATYLLVQDRHPAICAAKRLARGGRVMEKNYTGLQRSVVTRRAEAKRLSRERTGERLFQLFLIGALGWHAFGGLTMFNNLANTPQFYDGPVYIGVGAIVYSVGWWLRYSLTGWRGFL